MSLIEIKYINYLDTFSKQYKRILVSNIIPTDSTFKSIVKTISAPKLSIFEPIQATKCWNVIMNTNSKSEFLELSDIGILFNFLTINNFTLHSAFSDVIKQDAKFICYVSK